VTAVVLSLLAAAIGFFLGMVTGGGGHGWMSAAIFSLLLWPLLPLTFATRLFKGRRAKIGLVIALAIDVALLCCTQSEGWDSAGEVFAMAPIYPVGWLIVWLSWQTACLARCLGRHDYLG
jgi:hypothetical protein